MRELFVYYRVPVIHAEAAQAEVRRFQADLRKRHDGLTARLLRRPNERDDEQTWMEVYARQDANGSGIDSSLEADIDEAARPLSRFIIGERHVEVFVPCAS